MICHNFFIGSSIWLFLGILLIFSQVSMAAIEENDQGKTDVAPQVVVPIEFRGIAEAAIKTDRIYLEDILECIGSESICNSFFGIDLGKSPLPGTKKRISIRSLENRIRKIVPAIDPIFKGPKGVVVYGSYRKIDKRIFKEELNSALEKASSGKIRYRLRNLHLKRNILVRPGLLKISVLEKDFLQKKMCSTGFISVPFEISVTDETYSVSTKSVVAQARLECQRLTPVAKYRIPRGTVVDPLSIGWSWHTYQPLNDRSFSTAEDVVGLTTRQSFVAGQVFRKSSLKKTLLIRRGEETKLIFKNGTVNVVSKGKALENGRFDQIIRFIHSTTGKEIRGKILSNNEAIVVL